MTILEATSYICDIYLCIWKWCGVQKGFRKNWNISCYGRNKLLHMNRTLLSFVNSLSALVILRRNIVSTGLFCQVKGSFLMWGKFQWVLPSDGKCWNDLNYLWDSICFLCLLRLFLFYYKLQFIIGLTEGTIINYIQWVLHICRFYICGFKQSWIWIKNIWGKEVTLLLMCTVSLGLQWLHLYWTCTDSCHPLNQRWGTFFLPWAIWLLMISFA